MAKTTKEILAPVAPAEKLKVLEAAMAKLEKDYGKGAVMRLSDRPQENIAVIPSGSIAIDVALGIGGYPKGRIIEIFGPEIGRAHV